MDPPFYYSTWPSKTQTTHATMWQIHARHLRPFFNFLAIKGHWPHKANGSIICIGIQLDDRQLIKSLWVKQKLFVNQVIPFIISSKIKIIIQDLGVWTSRISQNHAEQSACYSKEMFQREKQFWHKLTPKNLHCQTKIWRLSQQGEWNQRCYPPCQLTEIFT